MPAHGRFGSALVVLGSITCVAAIAGGLGGWGESRTSAAASPGSSTPAAATVISSAPASTSHSSSTAGPSAGTSSPAAPRRGVSSGTTPRPVLSTPAGFLAALQMATDTKDAGFLLGHLNPAVLTRYGRSQCRRHLATFPTIGIVVQTIHAPAPFTWRTDRHTTVVPGTVAVDIRYNQGGSTTSQTVHVTQVNGEFTWFADCGVPVR